MPESLGAEEHLLTIRREIESFKPRRLIVDSVSAIARSEGERSFREFIHGLATYARANQVATLLTSTTPRLSAAIRSPRRIFPRLRMRSRCCVT